MFDNKENYIAEAQRHLGGKSESELSRLLVEILAAFQAWKVQHGNRKPTANVGMLSDLLGPKSLPFKTAEPWQCAGFSWPSPVALAMKLWLDDFAPLKAIADRDGIRRVLALLVVRYADKTSPNDLFKANDLIVRHYEATIGIVSGSAWALKRHQGAITAQKTRSTGGQTRAEQLKGRKDDKHKSIRDAETDLSPTTKPRNLNKAIAKALGLETDYVRKARKAMEREASGS